MPAAVSAYTGDLDPNNGKDIYHEFVSGKIDSDDKFETHRQDMAKNTKHQFQNRCNRKVDQRVAVALFTFITMEQFGNTRKLLEQLIGSDADILICTKSDLVVRDIDLLKKLGRVTVSWSINTLDENFKNDMDSASSIERRIAAMKQVYEAGIRTVCFVSPVFPRSEERRVGKEGRSRWSPYH